MAERLFVWLGGAAFVASLAFCAYTYGVTFGSAHAAGPTLGAAGFDGLHLIADLGLLAVFAAHHSVFARDAVKVRIAAIVPERLVRPVYVWTASILLAIVCAWWQPVGGTLYRTTGWTAAANAALQLTGLAVIAASVRLIDPLQFAGIRQPPPPATLQARGPYRFVRHPVYCGWMLVVFGAAHMTADRLAFAIMTCAYLVAAIPWEEHSLGRSFPVAYAEYRRLVRWRMVPFVY
jgi:methanethiol S-methyltransferase